MNSKEFDSNRNQLTPTNRIENTGRQRSIATTMIRTVPAESMVNLVRVDCQH